MHSALKVMLITQIRNKPIRKFKTKMQVTGIFNLADDLDKDFDEGIQEQ